MTWEWIRFGLVCVFTLAGLFTMFCSILGLYLFDFALNRIHSAAMADTLSLLLFLIGIMLAIGADPVVWKLLLILLLQWCTSPLSSHMLAQFEYQVDENLSLHVEVLDDQYYQEVDDK